jgi:hypothetical protein
MYKKIIFSCIFIFKSLTGTGCVQNNPASISEKPLAIHDTIRIITDSARLNTSYQWHVKSVGQSANLLSVTWGNGLFIATGENITYSPMDSAALFISKDAAVWKRQVDGITGGGTSRFHRVKWVHDRFFLFGDIGSSTYYSTNGENWKEMPLFSWNITYGNKLFLGIFFNPADSFSFGYTAISPDGINWTKSESLKDLYIDSSTPIAFGNNNFTMFASDSGNTITCMQSTDGKKWSSTAVPFPGNLMSLNFYDSRFFALGCGEIARSADGNTWSRSFDLGFPLSPEFSIPSMAWSGNNFLLVNGNGSVMSSHDGIDWVIQQQLPGFNTLTFTLWTPENITFGNDKYVVVCRNRFYIADTD